MDMTSETPHSDHDKLRELDDGEQEAVAGGTAQGVLKTKAVARPHPLYSPIAGASG
jgi:hypothetical protein